MVKKRLNEEEDTKRNKWSRRKPKKNVNKTEKRGGIKKDKRKDSKQDREKRNQLGSEGAQNPQSTVRIFPGNEETGTFWPGGRKQQKTTINFMTLKFAREKCLVIFVE